MVDKEIEKRESKAGKSDTNWLAVAASAISLGTAVMVLLGYGVALAAESVFHIPHAAVFDSAFELIDLASVAILEVFPALLEVLSNWSSYVKLYEVQGPVIVPLAGVLLVISIVGWFWQPAKKGPTTGSSLKVKKPTRQVWGHTPRQYWITSLVAVLLVTCYPLLSILGIVVILVGITVLSTAPLIGYVAGTTYINKWVIAPQQCAISNNLTERRKLIAAPRQVGKQSTVDAAMCVVVKKEGDEIGRGRVVFYTSKAVLLVDESGHARRVPTGDATVEVIDSL